MFYTIDFVLFGFFLLLSLFVGLYHGVMGKLRTQEHSKTAEFLTGGRQLPIIPVCLSLLSTFLSGVSLLSIPAEIYTRGFTWGIGYLSAAVAFIMIGFLFIPVFYKLKLRFNSKRLRNIATFIFTFNTLVYLAVVVYAPAISLTGVTGMQLWWLILAVGIVCTIYTALGGIKAVIWTDTLQAIFIYAGLTWLIIKGTSDAGGFLKVIEVSEQSGRLSKYNSAWIAGIGGLLYWTSTYGMNQMAIQRYCSMPSLKEARMVLFLAVPAVILVGFMTSYLGILMAAYFNKCDPMVLGEIKSVDQMTILMASRVFDSTPGLPGLFLATIFSATLSTISSGINSLTAVLWEDFLKERCKRMSDSKQALVMKALTFLFGIISIAMAFSCFNLGGIYHICIAILGATTGPLVGLFFLGVFFPSANKIGAFAGITVAIIVMIMCSAAYSIQMPYKNYILPPVEDYTSPSCVNYSANVTGSLEQNQFSPNFDKTIDLHYGDPDTLLIARLSPFLYSAIGVLIVVLIGVPVSYIFPQKQSPEEKKFAYACTFSGLNVEIDTNHAPYITKRSCKEASLKNGLKTINKPLIR